MVAKETAKQVINSLPDDASMDDIIHALYVNVKFARGEREIREGRRVSHEEAKNEAREMATVIWAPSALDDVASIAACIIRAFAHENGTE